MADSASDSEALQVVRLRHEDIEDCIDLARGAFDQFADDADPVRQWFDARVTNNPWQQAIDGIGVGIRHHGRLIAFRAK
jgi:hypothetical protein